jgi:predicted transcriptional regulator
MLLNKDEKGIIWGKYLFDYLLNKSVKIILW